MVRGSTEPDTGRPATGSPWSVSRRSSSPPAPSDHQRWDASGNEATMEQGHLVLATAPTAFSIDMNDPHGGTVSGRRVEQGGRQGERASTATQLRRSIRPWVLKACARDSNPVGLGQRVDRLGMANDALIMRIQCLARPLTVGDQLGDIALGRQ